MLTRIVLYLGLLAALIAGAVAVDNDALDPRAILGAMRAQAQTVAPQPGENAQPSGNPDAPPGATSAQPPAPVQQPYVIDQPAAPPAPVVTAPTPDPAAPPASAPAVVSPAPMPPEKPVVADPKSTDPKNGKGPVPAKVLFSAEKLPSLGKAMAIGYYPRGCLQGGVALPVNGPSWQVMRVSRNRNWGHPSLVRFLERFAPAAAKATGWKGILVGDMAQPRGGPTPFGHRSHQTGLDVDIWFMPMPAHTLSAEEREKTSAINLVADDWKRVNQKTWTPQHAAFIKTAAEQPGVERVLVNAAIKKEICRVDAYRKSDWMAKVRPWYAHHDHIHVRLKCPDDSPNCRGQPAVTDELDNGCSGKALDHWFSDKVLNPPKPTTPPKPPRPLTMADFPPACQTVLAAPERAQKD
jgi:penicillin-insensitive murein endopeptidase